MTVICENRKLSKTAFDIRCLTGHSTVLQALSDAHTYLFGERERLLKLQSDNDELRLQEIEDRKRIQHLLAMHGPLEQEITYSREGKPSTVTVFPRRGQENIPKRANQQDASERVMRTVYLPAANADNLMLRIESLQAQLNEQVCSLKLISNIPSPAESTQES